MNNTDTFNPHGASFFATIAQCSWDSSKTSQTTPDTEKNDTQATLFEHRGVSLSILRHIARATKQWPRLRRVLLTSGLTAIVLEHNSNGTLAVQLRTFNDQNVLQRSYTSIAKSMVLQDIEAAVGERVIVRPLNFNYSRNNNKHSAIKLLEHYNHHETSEYYTEYKGRDSTKELVLATVVGYADAHPLLVEHGFLNTDHPSVDANHAVPFLPTPLQLANGKDFDVILLDQRVTTKDTVEDIVKPMTRHCETSLVDMLAANDTLAQHVGPAEGFVSHAWKYEFADVVDALDLWFETTRLKRAQASDHALPLSPDECYLWFDIATVAQHASAQCKFPPNYFFNQFKKGIEAIGCTILVLMPWNDPIPLQRSWCVWEIYCTIHGQVLFETALSRKDQHKRDTHSMVISMEIKVENAQAWSLDDQTKIMDSCQRLEGGCEHVNNCIAEAFAFDQIRRTIHATAYPTVLQFSGMHLPATSVNCIVEYMCRPEMGGESGEGGKSGESGEGEVRVVLDAVAEQK